jgi:hypothetical protein
VAAEISEQAEVITLSDRELLEAIYRRLEVLGQLEPYLPLLARAAKLMDNPASRWRDRRGQNLQP